jgi:mono/diheme cytochrome c family protein
MKDQMWLVRPAPPTPTHSDAVPRSIGALAGALAFCIVRIAHSDDTRVPDLRDPKVIAAGRELFSEKHCSHCHGADGDGGVNLTHRDLSNPDYVYEAIADGQERGSLRMPAWRDVLSDAEIWQTTAYVMSIANKSE